MTIVDDYSRATCVHLLKLKSESLEIVQIFCNFALNQFGKQVKVIRSDNALDFDDSECKKFFRKQGIVHQTSCVDRPQQNGRVERKHMNILEMSRSLRLQAGLPLKLWGDCVLTDVYIITRLPTEILKNCTPYEKLFKKKLDYSEMKAFGCLAFASNPSRKRDKFSMRGVPFIFLGYPYNKKGYKLLNIGTYRCANDGN